MGRRKIPMSRKPEYRRKQSEQRRRDAVDRGLCSALCGTPLTEVNPRTGLLYVCCVTCREMQRLAHEKARKANKDAA